MYGRTKKACREISYEKFLSNVSFGHGKMVFKCNAVSNVNKPDKNNLDSILNFFERIDCKNSEKYYKETRYTEYQDKKGIKLHKEYLDLKIGKKAKFLSSEIKRKPIIKATVSFEY